MTKVPVTQERLVELIKSGCENGARWAVVAAVQEWTFAAATEIVNLRAACELALSRIESDIECYPKGSVEGDALRAVLRKPKREGS